MTIVEGQIETLKNLKESLSNHGITRFSSIGEINRFLKEFDSERRQILTQIAESLEREIAEMQTSLSSKQEELEQLRSDVRTEIENNVREIEGKIVKIKAKCDKNIIYKLLNLPRILLYTRRRVNLGNTIDSELHKKTKSSERTVSNLKSDLDTCNSNREEIIAGRSKKALAKLDKTKRVVDELYPLIAGAVGETSVVNTLQKLSDDYFLINDFSLRFDPPIYNKKKGDRIVSVQIDHLLIGPSGVFVLETKNWSKTSVANLDLRSPVEQISRTSYALFVLLNSKSNPRKIPLKSHHWGEKKIPIRNIVVMTKEKPREEFKHVKVVSLRELIGYIQYFDPVFDSREVGVIFEHLKKRMRKRA